MAPTAEPKGAGTVRKRQAGHSLALLIGLLLVSILAVRGAGPIYDNSFLTHLATGRYILDHGFPRRDPFSFTAEGVPWVLQSWFPSVVYAGLEDLFGAAGLRLFTASLHALGFALLWRLARPAQTIVGRVLSVAPAFVVGLTVWGERPQLVGLISFCLVLVILDEERDPRWMVPIMWLWVNSHGSFPVLFPLLGLFWLGSRLDGRPTGALERLGCWSLVGLLVAVVNPYGWRILWTPMHLLARSEALQQIIEWQAPAFTSLWQRIFLVAVLLAILGIPRMSEGDRYRVLLPTILLVAMSFIASRNIMLATVVLVMLLARQRWDVGTLRGAERSRANTALSALAILMCVGMVWVTLGKPDYALQDYPVKAVETLDADGLISPSVRLLTTETTGNYLEWLKGDQARVFIDDRVDVIPVEVFSSYIELLHGSPDWEKILDDHAIDVVLWKSDLPLAQYLHTSDAWHLVPGFDEPAPDAGGWVAYRRVLT